VILDVILDDDYIDIITSPMEPEPEDPDPVADFDLLNRNEIRSKLTVDEDTGEITVKSKISSNTSYFYFRELNPKNLFNYDHLPNDNTDVISVNYKVKTLPVAVPAQTLAMGTVTYPIYKHPVWLHDNSMLASIQTHEAEPVYDFIRTGNTERLLGTQDREFPDETTFFLSISNYGVFSHNLGLNPISYDYYTQATQARQTLKNPGNITTGRPGTVNGIYLHNSYKWMSSDMYYSPMIPRSLFPAHEWASLKFTPNFNTSPNHRLRVQVGRAQYIAEPLGEPGEFYKRVRPGCQWGRSCVLNYPYYDVARWDLVGINTSTTSYTFKVINFTALDVFDATPVYGNIDRIRVGPPANTNFPYDIKFDELVWAAEVAEGINNISPEGFNRATGSCSSHVSTYYNTKKLHNDELRKLSMYWIDAGTNQPINVYRGYGSLSGGSLQGDYNDDEAPSSFRIWSDLSFISRTMGGRKNRLRTGGFPGNRAIWIEPALDPGYNAWLSETTSLVKSHSLQGGGTLQNTEHYQQVNVRVQNIHSFLSVPLENRYQVKVEFEYGSILNPYSGSLNNLNNTFVNNVIGFGFLPGIAATHASGETYLYSYLGSSTVNNQGIGLYPLPDDFPLSSACLIINLIGAAPKITWTSVILTYEVTLPEWVGEPPNITVDKDDLQSIRVTSSFLEDRIYQREDTNDWDDPIQEFKDRPLFTSIKLTPSGSISMAIDVVHNTVGDQLAIISAGIIPPAQPLAEYEGYDALNEETILTSGAGYKISSTAQINTDVTEKVLDVKDFVVNLVPADPNKSGLPHPPDTLIEPIPPSTL